LFVVLLCANCRFVKEGFSAQLQYGDEMDKHGNRLLQFSLLQAGSAAAVPPPPPPAAAKQEQPAAAAGAEQPVAAAASKAKDAVPHAAQHTKEALAEAGHKAGEAAAAAVGKVCSAVLLFRASCCSFYSLVLACVLASLVRCLVGWLVVQFCVFGVRSFLGLVLPRLQTTSNSNTPLHSSLSNFLFAPVAGQGDCCCCSSPGAGSRQQRGCSSAAGQWRRWPGQGRGRWLHAGTHLELVM
jgi:hypothetical protein